MNVNDMCPMYNDGEETRLHALVECSFAQECWHRLNSIDMGGSRASFLDWTLNIFDSWITTQRQMGVMVLWAI